MTDLLDLLDPAEWAGPIQIPTVTATAAMQFGTYRGKSTQVSPVITLHPTEAGARSAAEKPDVHLVARWAIRVEGHRTIFATHWFRGPVHTNGSEA